MTKVKGLVEGGKAAKSREIHDRWEGLGRRNVERERKFEILWAFL